MSHNVTHCPSPHHLTPHHKWAATRCHWAPQHPAPKPEEHSPAGRRSRTMRGWGREGCTMCLLLPYTCLVQAASCLHRRLRTAAATATRRLLARHGKTNRANQNPKLGPWAVGLGSVIAVAMLGQHQAQTHTHTGRQGTPSPPFPPLTSLKMPIMCCPVWMGVGGCGCLEGRPGRPPRAAACPAPRPHCKARQGQATKSCGQAGKGTRHTVGCGPNTAAAGVHVHGWTWACIGCMEARRKM